MSAWATYQNALRLILTGDTTRPLNADQRTLFLHMVARGRRDENGNERESRELPGVQTQDRDGERFFFIPDLVHFMLNEFRDEWDIHGPPLDLDYLNSLKVGDEFPFLFGAAPSAKAWSENAMGQRHWELVCKEIEILGELAVLQRLHHADDPMKWREIRNATKEFKDELDAVQSELRDIEAGRENRRRLIPFEPPQRVRSDWPELIIDAIKEFEAEYGYTGSEGKIWARLLTQPPNGWKYTVRDNVVHFAGGELLTRSGFRDRFGGLYPNEKP